MRLVALLFQRQAIFQMFLDCRADKLSPSIFSLPIFPLLPSLHPVEGVPLIKRKITDGTTETKSEDTTVECGVNPGMSKIQDHELYSAHDTD